MGFWGLEGGLQAWSSEAMGPHGAEAASLGASTSQPIANRPLMGRPSP